MDPRPRILAIDDVMCKSNSDVFHNDIRARLEKCVAIAGGDLVWPQDKAAAIRAASLKPALVVLDIDLGKWGGRLNGYDFLQEVEEAAGRLLPLLVLSGEPKNVPPIDDVAARRAWEKKGKPSGIRGFSQTHHVVWIPKEEFRSIDEVFLANQIKCLATDPQNNGLQANFNKKDRTFSISKGGQMLCNLSFELTAKDEALYNWIVKLAKNHNEDACEIDVGADKKNKHRWIAAFNEEIVKKTGGVVATGLIVSAGESRFKLAIGTLNSSSKAPLPTAAAASLVDRIKDLEARFLVLESRIKTLEP